MQAVATLRLRRAGLQRAALDREIAGLAEAADAAGDGAAGCGAGAEAATVKAEKEEMAQLDELICEIEARLAEVIQAA